MKKFRTLFTLILALFLLAAAGCGGGDKAAAGGAKAGGQDLKGKKLVMYVLSMKTRRKNWRICLRSRPVQM